MTSPTAIIEFNLDENSAPCALGPIAIENACNKIVNVTGEYMTAYTIFVSPENVGLVLRMMAVMPRLGVMLDPALSPYEYRIATITPKMQVVVAWSAGI